MPHPLLLRHRLRRLAWPAAGACVFPAAAAAADQVQIALVGEIERTCALSTANAAVDLGDIRTTGRRDLALGVSCNSPFRYTLTSANGGLRHAGGLNRIGPFAELLPYRVDVTVPTDTGRAVFGCDSTALSGAAANPTGCPPADSGGGIALGGSAALALSWQTPPLPLPAGDFADALTISFSLKP